MSTNMLPFLGTMTPEGRRHLLERLRSNRDFLNISDNELALTPAAKIYWHLRRVGACKRYCLPVAAAIKKKLSLEELESFRSMAFRGLISLKELEPIGRDKK